MKFCALRLHGNFTFVFFLFSSCNLEGVSRKSCKISIQQLPCLILLFAEPIYSSILDDGERRAVASTYECTREAIRCLVITDLSCKIINYYRWFLTVLPAVFQVYYTRSSCMCQWQKLCHFRSQISAADCYDLQVIFLSALLIPSRKLLYTFRLLSSGFQKVILWNLRSWKIVMKESDCFYCVTCCCQSHHMIIWSAHSRLVLIFSTLAIY